jgi:hypothetical protein
MCLVLFPLVAATIGSTAEVIGRTPRVLILYPYDERIPGTCIAGETAREKMLEV